MVPLNSLFTLLYLLPGLSHSDNTMDVQPFSGSSGSFSATSLSIATSFSLSKSDPFHSRKGPPSLAQLSVKSQRRPNYISPNPNLSSFNFKWLNFHSFGMISTYTVFPLRQEKTVHSGYWKEDGDLLPAVFSWSCLTLAPHAASEAVSSTCHLQPSFGIDFWESQWYS